MLVLSRRTNESLTIGPDIRVTIVHIGPGKVRVGIDAPPEVLVLRNELEELSEGDLSAVPHVPFRRDVLAAAAAGEGRAGGNDLTSINRPRVAP